MFTFFAALGRCSSPGLSALTLPLPTLIILVRSCAATQIKLYQPDFGILVLIAYAQKAISNLVYLAVLDIKIVV